MPKVTVFNPANGPVFIDNARVIGGAERATVALTPLIKAFIDQGVLIDKTKADPPPKSVEQPAAPVDPAPIDDGSSDEPPVSSVVEDDGQTVADDEESQPKPASMKRRRKSSPVKE